MKISHIFNKLKADFGVSMKNRKACLKMSFGLLLTAAFLFLGYYFFEYKGENDVMLTESKKYSIDDNDMPDKNDWVRKVAITFDDGPDPEYTPKLLDGLRERDVKATFFLLGSEAEKYPDIVKQINKDGHLIGNHTYSHVSLKNADVVLINQEVVKTNKILEELTGKTPQYIRPPYGEYGDKDNLEDLTGMICVLWTVESTDWYCKDAAAIVKLVEGEVTDNAIIILHDKYKSSIMAALTIVDDLKKQGYEFVTLDEILFE